MKVNEKKSKEMVITFKSTLPSQHQWERARGCAPFQTPRLSDNLSWHHNTSKICAKVGPSLYYLKRCGLKQEDLITFYITVIRPLRMRVLSGMPDCGRDTSVRTATEASSEDHPT